MPQQVQSWHASPFSGTVYTWVVRWLSVFNLISLESHFYKSVKWTRKKLHYLLTDLEKTACLCFDQITSNTVFPIIVVKYSKKFQRPVIFLSSAVSKSICFYIEQGRKVCIQKSDFCTKYIILTLCICFR